MLLLFFNTVLANFIILAYFAVTCNVAGFSRFVFDSRDNVDYYIPMTEVLLS